MDRRRYPVHAPSYHGWVASLEVYKVHAKKSCQKLGREDTHGRKGEDRKKVVHPSVLKVVVLGLEGDNHGEEVTQVRLNRSHVVFNVLKIVGYFVSDPLVVDQMLHNSLERLDFPLDPLQFPLNKVQVVKEIVVLLREGAAPSVI